MKCPRRRRVQPAEPAGSRVPAPRPEGAGWPPGPGAWAPLSPTSSSTLQPDGVRFLGCAPLSARGSAELCRCCCCAVAPGADPGQDLLQLPYPRRELFRLSREASRSGVPSCPLHPRLRLLLPPEAVALCSQPRWPGVIYVNVLGSLGVN